MSRHLKVKELQTDSTQADAMHCYATFVGDKNTWFLWCAHVASDFR